MAFNVPERSCQHGWIKSSGHEGEYPFKKFFNTVEIDGCREEVLGFYPRVDILPTGIKAQQ
jgi:hypothetical protein